MSGASKKLMGTTAAGADFIAVEDVFSTFLYTGNGSTQTITNGIDLAGEGGLVWLKSRSQAYEHQLHDSTAVPVWSSLNSNNNAARASESQSVNQLNSDGFVVGGGDMSVNGDAYVTWTFRKAPRFFDVVTYTGTGSARTVDHNLGTTVGSIIIKRTDASANWAVYHRGNTAAPETDFLSLNLTNATADDATYWNDTAPTDSVFTIGTNAVVNASGGTYVAYLFAHDPLGPSEDGSDGLIACGSYTGTASGTFATINLGWEPQFVLTKKYNNTSNWMIHDTMRGMSYTGFQAISPNLSAAEETKTFPTVRPTPTGFEVQWGSNESNAGTDTAYIYIAIRRGPMRAPESGTEVFAADTGTYSAAKLTTGFDTDLLWQRVRGSVSGNNLYDRMRGSLNILQTNSTSAETPNFANGVRFDQSEGVFVNDGANDIHYAFRRAPEFFDVVAYTGNGTAGRTVPHNLGVAPEMMIVKVRSGRTDSWIVYHGSRGATEYAKLDTTDSFYTGPAAASTWNTTEPTSSEFTLGSDGGVNQSGATYIAYLFATLAGVSKVGSYTGNGTSQTIDCGFTSGARFIIIKRADSAGDWYVWDTARGIVTGNDPFLELNTTDAEVTSDDSIDPDSSGFIVNQTATTNVNVSSASYIFLAIA